MQDEKAAHEIAFNLHHNPLKSEQFSPKNRLMPMNNIRKNVDIELCGNLAFWRRNSLFGGVGRVLLNTP